MKNLDKNTVSSFGDEWSRHNQSALKNDEKNFLFNKYFSIFPWECLPSNASGFDMGCGSGRWAQLVATKISNLTCIDPSRKALEVARKNLSHLNNITFLNASASDKVLPPNSQDFGYSLGVLHHVPDTLTALKDCVEMLKPGAPFLIYLYYKFDNRPSWYVLLWKISDILRKYISQTHPILRSFISDIIAIVIYLPLSRLALLGEKIGLNVNNWVLSNYRKTSIYTMRTDSRDRFGTPLEKRFTRLEITLLMKNAGLGNITFSESFPFWCAVGKKI